MLFLADLAFDALHIFVIVFNLFGWVLPRTRVAHRWLVAATTFCWLVIGPAIGTLGYCPLTDWHWQIKEMRGAKDLPDSYIDYLLQIAGIHADPDIIRTGTGIVFGSVLLLTIGLWLRERRVAKVAAA